MIIAQESRGEDPASLYPRWCTNDYHGSQYEGLAPLGILDKDDIEAAYQERLESGNLPASVLPPCVKPRQAGRHKKHQRFEDAAREKLVKPKRGRGQDSKKMQRKTQQKAKKGMISGLAGVPSRQKGSGAGDEEEEVEDADTNEEVVAQDQPDHETVDDVEVDFVANSVPFVNASSPKTGDADVIDDGASTNEARAGKRPAADPPASSLRCQKKRDVGRLREDGDQPSLMSHVREDEPAASRDASADSSSWYPTTVSAKHVAQARLRGLIDELINEQRDSVRVMATDKNPTEDKSPSDYVAGTAKVEHRQSKTYIVVEYDDGSAADSHEWGGDGCITSEIDMGYYLPANLRGSEQQVQAREYVSHSCCTNCVISTALAAMLCRRRCDADRVIADFAFFPPNPPTYVPQAGEGPRKGPLPVRKIDWKYRDLERNPLFARFKQVDGREGRPRCNLLRTSRQELVPSFFFEFRGREDLCVIYFHANATDCGAMLPTYSAFSRRLGVSVLAVEYSGYGGATGRASVANTLADARAAYDEARRLEFPPERIVLYGQSVGSGPACYLAARRKVAGLILHSPIASGIRSLTGGGCCSPVYVYACLDPYNNLAEMKKARCLVLVIHGTADEEIPFAHGKMLHAAAKHPHDPFWVEGAGHNNILETAENDYFRRINRFLDAVVAKSKKDATNNKSFSAFSKKKTTAAAK
ncbi:hypothetical protein CTAYLR_010671 [Chrysophaeum taylorii]|uniref:Uncharacterized protein n=1 Tax=Chrysophaeum taylorii TaxID=2483200 RepID=A0AAD7XEX7_9STRA|nr:hypothetical protein CTAYLR_010671 [Chrysophaeum taylorii]